MYNIDQIYRYELMKIIKPNKFIDVCCDIKNASEFKTMEILEKDLQSEGYIMTETLLSRACNPRAVTVFKFTKME